MTFEQTQDSNQHGGSKGCIICGSKYLADYSVSEIFENIDKLQKISIPKVKGLVLDDEIFYLSSGNTNCLFAGSCSDLSFDGKENVVFFIRLVKSILGNDCHLSMCER